MPPHMRLNFCKSKALFIIIQDSMLVKRFLRLFGKISEAGEVSQPAGCAQRALPFGIPQTLLKRRLNGKLILRACFTD